VGFRAAELCRSVLTLLLCVVCNVENSCLSSSLLISLSVSVGVVCLRCQCDIYMMPVMSASVNTVTVCQKTDNMKQVCTHWQLSVQMCVCVC